MRKRGSKKKKEVRKHHVKRLSRRMKLSRAQRRWDIGNTRSKRNKKAQHQRLATLSRTNE